MSKLLLSEQSSAPSTPAAGKVGVYVDNAATPNLVVLDDSGVPRNVTTGLDTYVFPVAGDLNIAAPTAGKVQKFFTGGTSAGQLRATLSDAALTMGSAVSLVAAAGTTTVPPMTIPNGTNLTTQTANAIENDGVAFYGTIDTTSGRAQFVRQNIFRLTANGAAIGAAITDFFGANSAFPFVTNGVYEITYYLYFTKQTAGTVTFTVTNTQTFTNLNADYYMSAIAGDGTVGTAQTAGIKGATTAVTALPVTGSLANNSTHYAVIHVIAECATAGNIRLRVTESAGTITPQRGSFYVVRRIATSNVGTFVA